MVAKKEISTSDYEVLKRKLVKKYFNMKLASEGLGVNYQKLIKTLNGFDKGKKSLELIQKIKDMKE